MKNFKVSYLVKCFSKREVIFKRKLRNRQNRSPLRQGGLLRELNNHFIPLNPPPPKESKLLTKKIDLNCHRITALKVSIVHYHCTFNNPSNELMKLLFKTSGLFFSLSLIFLLILENCLEASSISSIS